MAIISPDSNTGKPRVHALDASIAVRVIRQCFLNRTDCVAFLPSWGTPCPCEAGENLDALLHAHLLGNDAPPVSATWTDANGNHKQTRGRFRIGTYCPATDNSTVFGCVDCDGKGHHTVPLADPLGVAVQIFETCERLGLAVHLERSGSATGWHVWFLFAGAIQAAKIRQLLFGVVPPKVQLADGTEVETWRGRGVEIFPKQNNIAPDGYGNMLWVPWWQGAAEGGNQFYRIEPPGQPILRPMADFEHGLTTITEPDVDRALTTLKPTSQPPRKRGTASRSGTTSTRQDPGRRVPTRTLLQRAKKKISECGGRNNAGEWLAIQLRDNGYSKTEAETVLVQFADEVGQDGDHEYTHKEARATVRSIYKRAARKPWSFSGSNGDGKHRGDQGESTPGEAAPTDAGDGTKPDKLEDAEPSKLNDVGNGQWLISKYENDLHYIHPWRKWLVWSEGRWREDDMGDVTRFAKLTIRGLYRWAAEKIAEIARQEEQGV
jgi:hypothetical protein